VTPEPDVRAALDRARGVSGSTQLTRIAGRFPEKTGFIYAERSYSFAEVDARVDVVARGLASVGVTEGDRVAMLMGNSMATVEAYFALSRLNAIAVPINLRFVAPEIEFILADSGTSTLLVDQAYAETAARARAPLPDVPSCLVVGGDAQAAGPGSLLWDEVIDGDDGGPPQTAIDNDDPAMIMYTSGTTGRPKGAVLTHYGLAMSALSAMIEQQLSESDEVWYLNLPLFHISGMAGIYPYMFVGGTSVIAPLGAFDAATAVDDLERHQVTAACFVGPQWQAIVALPGVEDRHYALRRVIWGTSPAIVPLLEAVRRAFPHVAVYNTFGQTEMSPVSCMLKAGDFDTHKGSVGKPVINVEARIVDDAMRDVTPGEVGEIVYRGPNVMKEYWNLPEATEEAFSGGWFHSGDLCRQDEDGFIYVVDRKKDVVISGGENIYSAEVEAVIVRHPKVRDVAVIGVPHPKWGETPWAIVTAADPSDPPTEDELVEFCRNEMASFKKPSSFIILEGDLPRNAMGKVTKPALRERYGGSFTETAQRPTT
jgi:acyl-CoA synthetase (AMP-forming)/AMP-acid ligase II